jgi:hypothetical protein
MHQTEAEVVVNRVAEGLLLENLKAYQQETDQYSTLRTAVDRRSGNYWGHS